MANGLDEKRAVAFAHQVREMDQRGLGIRVFSGLECDIRRDGAMDLEDDALGELDFVIGSVHSYMNLEAVGNDRPAAARARMPAPARPGASHRPHSSESRCRIRSISTRVAGSRAARRTFLEINASPERLDLTASLVRAAKARGAKFGLDRRAPSQASAQHALRRSDGAARMARRPAISSTLCRGTICQSHK